MSRCPQCQHDLSQEELQSRECPSCGLKWDGDLPTPGLGPSADETITPDDLAPQISAGKARTGLTSETDPETWNVDSNSKTVEAADLTPDDIERMSVMWGGVDDEVPSGMTIKSLEEDEIDEHSPTISADEFASWDDEDADENAATYSGDAVGEEVDDQAATFVSDEFPPADASKSDSQSDSSANISDVDKDWSEASISDTFVSDEFPEGAVKHDTPEQQSTPSDSGSGEYDQTVVADDFMSDEHDSQDLADESAKTMPMDDMGEWDANSDGQTYVPDGEEFGNAGDSQDKTIVTEDRASDQYTDSGTNDGAQKTDPLGSEDFSGSTVAAESGLVIQVRSMLDQADDPNSETADYEVLSLLGEGGMGKVFNARQTSIDRKVAVKMLKPKKSGKKIREQEVKFLAEAVVTGELDHPNIVPIYDVGQDQKGALFYSMKNVTGNPWLDTIVNKGTHENLEVLMSVADAVAFAHARGVVHRDLKPENVMLGEFGEVLVMDWGLAMPTEKFQQKRGMVKSTSMGGTPAYMAPEMATGPIGKIGPHSDIYLLGAILFEIVTGRPPHRGKNAMKCLMAAAKNKIVQTDITGELIEIAYKAMATESKDRYKSVQEFQAAVRTYLAHSESLMLAAAAEEDLERAQQTDSYEDYSKSRFGFEEALKLWDGNKRARTQLGAARLAYAHCAMGKGDYDLAASLLDPNELSHERLRADIKTARDERDARQKRLETAKLFGRFLVAALILVLTTAALWINDERGKAEASEAAAVIARDDAIDAQAKEAIQRKKAQDLAAQEAALKQQALDAVRAERLANIEAERRRKEALAQRIFSDINAIIAEEQEQVARAAAAAERLANIEAERRRKEALAQRIFSDINAIIAEEQEQLARAAAEAERVAKIETDRQRRLAVGQSIATQINAMLAEEQEQIAEANAIEARRQESIAKAQEAKAIDLAKKERFAKEQSEIRRKEAENQRVIAGINAIIAEEQEQIAAANAIEARRQEAIAKAQEAKAILAAESEKKQRLIAEEAKINEEREAYNSKIGLAAALIEENAFDAAETLLDSTNPLFRNWEWGHLKHLCQQEDLDFKSSARLEAVALMGDTGKFVIAGQSGLVEIRDLSNPEQRKFDGQIPNLPENIVINDVAVSPNGNLIALATNDEVNGFIKLFDVKAGQYRDTVFGINNPTFATEEEYLTKHEISHMDPVESVAFSKDGQKLLTASQDRSARVWKVETGEQLVRLYGNDKFRGHTGIVWQAIFCPNPNANESNGETRIVTVSEDKTAIVWDDSTGRWNNLDQIEPLPPFRGHNDQVYSVACSEDGKYIATGGYGRRVLLWQPADIPEVDEEKYFAMLLKEERVEPLPTTPFRELIGHEAPIRGMTFVAPKDDARDLVLVTSADDNTIKIWNIDKQSTLEKMGPVKTFRGHGGYVRDLVLNPESTWILSVSHDNSAKRWSLDKDASQEIYLVNGSPLDGHTNNVDAVAFGFKGDSKKVATASKDNTARIYDLDDKNRVKAEHVIAEGHDNLISSGVYFDGGKRIVTASFDNTSRVWDVMAGSEKLKFEGTGSNGVLAVSKDGAYLLTGGDNDNPDEQPWQAKLWSLKEGTLIKAFGAHPQQITAVSINPVKTADGSWQLATADGRGNCIVWLFTPKAEAKEATVTESKTLVRFGKHAHEGRITEVAFLPDNGGLLTASHDNAVTQWNVATGEASGDFKHPAEISSLSVSANGRYVATTCFDNIVRLWDRETGETIREFRPEGRTNTLMANLRNQFALKMQSTDTLKDALAILDPNANVDQFLKSGGWEQGVEQLVAQIPEQLANLNAPPKDVAGKLANLFDGVTANDLLLASTNSISLSPDARYLVVANRNDRIVHGWRLPADPASDEAALAFELKDNLDTWAVVCSPARNRTDVMVLGFSDARQWKLDAGPKNTVQTNPTMTLRSQDEVAAVEFSPDGDYLVTGASDTVARVFNARTGKSLLSLQGGHTEPINATVWAPVNLDDDNAKYLLTASDDTTAVLWKLTPNSEGGFGTPEKVHTYKGHTAAVTDAAFSPDGKRFVTVSRDRKICLWNTRSADKPIAEMQQDEAILCVAYADTGDRILTGSSSNQAIIWGLAEADGAVTFEQRLVLLGHSAEVMDVAFSPLEDLDGNGEISELESAALRAVTASADNTVIVWDTREPTAVEEGEIPKGNQVLTLKRHERPVNAVKFSPDGRYILTGSDDNRAFLWPTENWMAEKLAEKIKEQERKEAKENVASTEN